METEYDFKQLAEMHSPLKRYIKEYEGNVTLDWNDEEALY